MEIFNPLHPIRAKRLKGYIKRLPGLVGYWPMNEVSGVVARNHAPATLGSNNGTITNALVGQDGLIGKAYYFDGTGDYISLGTFDPSYASMTLCGLISIPTASLGSARSIISKRDSWNAADMRWDFGLNTSNVFIYGKSGASATFSTYGTAYPKDNWFMFCLVKSVTATTLYINGALAEAGVAVEDGTDATAVMSIGRAGGQDAQYVIGNMQHIFITNTALNTSQVLKLAQIAKLA